MERKEDYKSREESVSRCSKIRGYFRWILLAKSRRSGFNIKRIEKIRNNKRRVGSQKYNQTFA